jgi:hypothetical protein
VRTAKFILAACMLLSISGCSWFLGNCEGGSGYSSVAGYGKKYEEENIRAGSPEGASFWASERKFYCDGANDAAK